MLKHIITYLLVESRYARDGAERAALLDAALLATSRLG